MQPRGPYRKSYLVRHGRSGWKYVRAIPRRFQVVEGKKAWRQCFGSISRADAEIEAHKLAAEHGERIQKLKSLTDQELALVAFSGGADGARGSASVDRYLADQLERSNVANTSASVARLRKVAREKTAAAAKVDGLPVPDRAAVMALVDVWQRVRAPVRETVVHYTTYMNSFAEVIGHAVEPKDVTRDHVVAFRNSLAERPGMTESNATKHLDAVKAVFSVAVSENLVDANPAKGVKAYSQGKRHSGGKQSFTSDQARAIFKIMNETSADAMRLTPRRWLEFKWVLRLIAYHGARSGEICQLRCSDVRKIDGVWALRITDEDTSARVKNAPSVRDVPLHPKCREFVKFAQATAAEHGADAPVFGTFPLWKGMRGRWFQNWGNRNFLKKAVGIKDKRYTMHCWRHTFRDLCDAAEMPDRVSRAIMGHARGDVHNRYGVGPPMRMRSKWIAKIDPLSSANK